MSDAIPPGIAVSVSAVRDRTFRVLVLMPARDILEPSLDLAAQSSAAGAPAAETFEPWTT